LTNVDESGCATIEDAPTQSGLIFFLLCAILTVMITINIYSVKKAQFGDLSMFISLERDEKI